MTSTRQHALISGICFLCSFLCYAVGTYLMETVNVYGTSTTDIISSRDRIITGGLIVSLLHTIFNIGLLVSMFSIVKPLNQFMATAYLIAGIIGTCMLALGSIVLMISVPLSEKLYLASNDSIELRSILHFCSGVNFFLYQIGMALWGAGGIVFCYLLYRYQLLSIIFSVFGLSCYILFIMGTILELYGYPVGTLLSGPGGLFEITLSIFLICKGIKQAP